MEQIADTLALTIPETCHVAKISRAALYALWAVGQGPRVRSIGRKRIVLREDLETWLRSLA